MSEASKIKSEVMPYLKGEGLDLGCADDKIIPSAKGVDIRPGFADITADLRSVLPVDDESQDYVFSSHTLEDLKDTQKALGDWWRVVKPGGYLILYLPDKRWYPNIGHPLANKAHKHDWTREEFMGLLPKLLTGDDWVIVRSEDRPPPDGIYDYENRGNIEYSFLLILLKKKAL